MIIMSKPGASSCIYVYTCIVESLDGYRDEVFLRSIVPGEGFCRNLLRRPSPRELRYKSYNKKRSYNYSTACRLPLYKPYKSFVNERIFIHH